MTPSLKHLISRAHPGSIFGLAYLKVTRGQFERRREGASRHPAWWPQNPDVADGELSGARSLGHSSALSSVTCAWTQHAGEANVQRATDSHLVSLAFSGPFL